MTSSISKPASPEVTPAPVIFARKVARFFALTVANLNFMLISCFVIARYSPPSSGSVIGSNTPYTILGFQVHDLIAYPTASVAIAAAVFYLLALSSFPLPGTTDEGQVHFLVGGAVVGYLGVTKLGWGSEGGEDELWGRLRAVIPGCVLVGLVCSLVFHAIGRWWEGKMVEELKEEGQTKSERRKKA